jgi:hypothetical protein
VSEFKDYIKDKKPVGKKTSLKTTYKGKSLNRNVYITSDGEKVSEKSTTFKYNNKMINIPTIHKGYKFNQKELRAMLKDGIIKPTSKSKTNLTNKINGNPTANLKTQYKSMGKKAGQRSDNIRFK